MFDWLYNAIGTMLSWFSSLFGGSYALALLLYALLFKLLFLPFSIKQQKNQIKMAKLAPQIELIKAKYRGRNDQPTMQKMQQEIMEFQQKEGYSPFSGCLPLLLQLPIIMFLYNIIRNPLSHICKLGDDAVIAIHKLVNGLESAAEFKSIDQITLISGIQNYSDKAAIEAAGLDFATLPDFTLFGIDFAAQPSLTAISWLVLVPFIAAGLTWLSMWLSRKWNGNGMSAMQTQDAQAKASMTMMDIMMPAMTLFIAFGFSGMLGLYWIYQSALGILQTFILSRVMPMPKYTAEELKAMRKAQKAAEKAQRQVLKEQPKYRSLHYIDEDDYDTRPELKRQDGQKSQKKNSNMSIDSPEIKD
ncbi:MAG: membrane protein insertase YidC [Clostridia bacterium]|nr:membrane protein insertase YidC [Clostridia bacterium]MBP3583089.1 membrane protein insertase YidC [Clostridia bacterium]